MSHYKSNVRDIEFNLFEVLGREEILGTEPYADLDRETVSAVLAEADRLARTKLAESFADGDLPVFDPKTHSVTCRRRSRSPSGHSWTLGPGSSNCRPSSAVR